jgi:hypothetical protein
MRDRRAGGLSHQQIEAKALRKLRVGLPEGLLSDLIAELREGRVIIWADRGKFLTVTRNHNGGFSTGRTTPYLEEN